MFILLNILYGITGLLVFTLALGWWMNGYFRRRGVKSPPAYLPFFGHMLPMVMQKQHMNDFIMDICTRYPDERYVGILQFTEPLIIIKDLDLLKLVAIKDFDHFEDHMSYINESADILFGNSLISLRGQKWRDMRATLSPAFTGSKMKGMFQFIIDCGEQMTDYYVKEMDICENKVRGLVELEMKDAFTRYTNDVIATIAFGLETNSFTEMNNQFYVIGKQTANFAGLRFLAFLFVMFLPRLAKFLGIQIFSKKITDYYRTLVSDTMKHRENNNVVRNDMIQLLMEARKGTLRHDSNEDSKDAGFATVEKSSTVKETGRREWTDDELVAQAALFLIAGFDTSSTLLCFLSHELALHPEIQRRLQKEIDEVEASIDGKLTYDCLQKMKYMDMVVSETLRKWPPVVATDRQCVKPYTLPAPNKDGEEVHLAERNAIWIPIYAIHHDPKYYKNPEVFDPERFSDENKDNIKPFTFIPFGVGPRNCTGSRFSLMEIKVVIYKLLLKFDIVTTAKTQNPIQLRRDTFNMHSEKGFWLGLKPREK